MKYVNVLGLMAALLITITSAAIWTGFLTPTDLTHT
ncbi:hypothetical protein BH20ACI2_BH20ACI2_24950 [soil metagenome]